MEEILKIIDVHIKTNRYINCLENIFVLFETYDIPFSDRKDIIKQIDDHNQKLYSEEKIKEDRIVKIGTMKCSVKAKAEPIVEKPIKQKPEVLNIDVSMYIIKIKETDDANEIISILPERDNPDFDSILSSILINLYKEKVEIINFMNEQENRKEVESIFETELEQIDFKMETILDYKDFVEDIELPKETNNKIVFMKNSSFEPVIFQNLKGYEEYYDSFLDLLNSIIDGSFKRMKAFTNNNKINNIYEVKNFKTRILFSRLKDNVYVVIAAFVKKCDIELRINNFIKNCSYQFGLQKEMLLASLADEESRIQEEKYLADLKLMLSERMKVRNHETYN